MGQQHTVAAQRSRGGRLRQLLGTIGQEWDSRRLADIRDMVESEQAQPFADRIEQHAVCLSLIHI